MDAREYLSRKGLDGERDGERPNTLEEKAWSRAREAGDHRPHAGTPFDWEDWERYHDDLAGEADRIQQKIDKEAHRRALEHEDGAGPTGEGPGDGAVQTFTPPVQPPDEPVPAGVPHFALLALAVLLPPLALGLAAHPARRVALNLLLTLLGWLPGVVHALYRIRRG